MNETQIIVKKLRSLRSLTDKPGTATHNPANTVQDIESQSAALKVRVACLEKTLLSHRLQALNLAHLAAATLIQKLKHNRTLSTNETVPEFISTVLQPSVPLDYYTAEPHSPEGKTRNRLTSCKSFSGRASDLATDLQAILDPSVAKSSGVAHKLVVGEKEEDSVGQAGEGAEEGDFFHSNAIFRPPCR